MRTEDAKKGQEHQKTRNIYLEMIVGTTGKAMGGKDGEDHGSDSPGRQEEIDEGKKMKN